MKNLKKKPGRKRSAKKDKLIRIYVSLYPHEIEFLEDLAIFRDEPVGVMLRKVLRVFIRENS